MLFQETEYKFVVERNEHFFVYKIIVSKMNVSGVEYWNYRTFINAFPLAEEAQETLQTTAEATEA